MLSDDQTLLETGTILTTMDGSYRTNAIISNFNDGVGIEVLTDFGNLIHFDTSHDLLGIFNICEKWIECKNIGYPLPSVVERIQEQIDLLNEARERILSR